MVCACRETIERVQQALEELEARVGRSEAACSASVAALRDDTAASVAALREQRDRGEAAAAELRGAVADADATATSRTDALQAQLQARSGSHARVETDQVVLCRVPLRLPGTTWTVHSTWSIRAPALQAAVDKVARELEGVRGEQAAALRELEAAAAAAKQNRDSDLEIIERALAAAHHNHEAVRHLHTPLRYTAWTLSAWPGRGSYWTTCICCAGSLPEARCCAQFVVCNACRATRCCSRRSLR
jgi:DNA repair exonuclease SbcCD ATPase subunit